MAKKGGGTEPDELEMLKAAVLAKELEVFTVKDKMVRLEGRSQSIEASMEKLSTTSRERIDTLTDIINFLTSEGTAKDKRISELETDLAKAEQDRTDTITRMNKEMQDLKNAQEFALNSMKLQLEAATVKLREMHEFSLRKKAMEDELGRLKDQLLREQRDHAEAISDVERVSVQEKERLKKEIQTRVDETKKEMTKMMEEQLHSKTKRTILENEQLRKEVAYHTHQTDMLLQQNDKLIQEMGEVARSLQLSKELEEDLARRNHMYQKTTRILVFKLRERQMQSSQGKKTEKEIKDEDELKDLLKRTERMKVPQQPDSQSGLLDSKGMVRDEAVKFLYTCLEDLELERIAKVPVDNVTISAEPTPRNRPDVGLSDFTLQQRQALLKGLLRQAVSLRSMTDNMTRESPRSTYSVRSRGSPKGLAGNMRPRVRVDDILAMPVDKMLEENP